MLSRLRFLPSGFFFIASVFMLVRLSDKVYFLSELLGNGHPDQAREMLDTSVTLLLWWAAIFQICVLVSSPAAGRAGTVLRAAATLLALVFGTAFAVWSEAWEALALYVTSIAATWFLDAWQRQRKDAHFESGDTGNVDGVLQGDNVYYALRVIQLWLRRPRSDNDFADVRAAAARSQRPGMPLETVRTRVSARPLVEVDVTWLPDRSARFQVRGLGRRNARCAARVHGMLEVLDVRSAAIWRDL